MYPQAADLITAGAQNSPDTATLLSLVDSIRQARALEDLPFPSSDPRYSPLELVAFESGRSFSDKDYFYLLSREKAESVRSADTISTVHSVGFRSRRAAIKAGIPISVLLDVVLSAAQIDVKGDDSTAYRIKIETPPLPGVTSERQWTAIVIRQEGRYRVADFTYFGGALGALALDRAERDDLATARKLLDWQRDDANTGRSDDPFSGWVFSHFWTKGMEADKDTIRYAATSLMVYGPFADKAVEVLREGRAKASSDADRLKFEGALAQAYRTLHRYDDMLASTKVMIDSYPNSDVAYQTYVSALLNLRRWQDCLDAAQARLKRLPDDLAPVRTQISVAQQQGDWGRAAGLYDRLLSGGNSIASDWNNFAWDSLLADKVTPAAVQATQRAASLTQNNAEYILHTLASIYAETGKVSEARAVLLQAMDADGMEQPTPDFWYVFGRIAEQLGEFKTAETDYKKTEKPKDALQLPTSTYELAQRRLKILSQEAK